MKFFFNQFFMFLILAYRLPRQSSYSFHSCPFSFPGGLVLCFQNMQYLPLYQLAQAVPDNVLTSLCEMYSFASSITVSSVGSCSPCQVLSPGHPILSTCRFLSQHLPSAGGTGKSNPYSSFPRPKQRAPSQFSRASFNGRGFLMGLIQALNIPCPFWDVRLDL